MFGLDKHCFLPISFVIWSHHIKKSSSQDQFLRRLRPFRIKHKEQISFHYTVHSLTPLPPPSSHVVCVCTLNTKQEKRKFSSPLKNVEHTSRRGVFTIPVLPALIAVIVVPSPYTFIGQFASVFLQIEFRYGVFRRFVCVCVCVFVCWAFTRPELKIHPGQYSVAHEWTPPSVFVIDRSISMHGATQCRLLDRVPSIL